jgi:chaperonin GroES
MANSIQKLVSFIGSENVAKAIQAEKDGEETLKKLASQVVEDFLRDQDSMKEWTAMVEEGRKVAKQETAAKSEPWPGASNFKSPAIIEASITFGDRASTEILRGRNLVKADIIGKDEGGAKKQSSENTTEYMNWQINHQMVGWRKAQEKLLYQLPSVGAVFKKTFFDPVDGMNKAELIHYPNFVINQATSSMAEAQAFTHPMDFGVDEVIVRKASGQWLDVEIYPQPAENDKSNSGTNADKGTNEGEGVDNAIDNPEKFLEQNCFYDLDGDGYREPYTVTVHQQTEQVVRIVARYDVDGIIIKDEAGNIRGLNREDGPGLEGITLVKINPNQNIVPYDFIPSTDGTFLGIGYYHLLSSLSKGINSTTNQLLDSGTLATLQGGFLARGFRKKMGNLLMKPGHWEGTDISAQDLQTGVLPHQFKEPSTVLFTLNESLSNKIQQLTVNTDIKGVLAPNAPATTTLALIQEAMMPMSAIMQRIIMSESEEFRQLFILNAKFTDPVLYQTILDDETADFAVDFNLTTLDIAPTASPDMSSKMQRIQRAQTLVLDAPNIALEGGDTRAIRETWFEAMGAEDLISQVFPDPEAVEGAQAERLAEQKQQQRQQQQLMNIQVDQAERELVRKEQETGAKLRVNLAEIRKIESEVILNLEKAESEDVKNQLSKYTAQLQAVGAAIDNTIKANEAENAERISREPRPAQAGAPNIPGGVGGVAR